MNNQQRQMTQMNRQMNPMNNQMNPINNQMNGGNNPMNAMGSINNPLNKANGKINQVLPAEMLERIFLLLEPKDLKNAVLVCKRWAQVTYNRDALKETFHFHFLITWTFTFPCFLRLVKLPPSGPGFLSHWAGKMWQPWAPPGCVSWGRFRFGFISSIEIGNMNIVCCLPVVARYASKPLHRAGMHPKKDLGWVLHIPGCSHFSILPSISSNSIHISGTISAPAPRMTKY